MQNQPFGDPVKVIGQVPAPIPVIGHFGVTLPSSPPRPRLSVPAAGVRIRKDLLVADLVVKLRRGEIDPHGPNLEADIYGAIRLAEVAEVNWHTEQKGL